MNYMHWRATSDIWVGQVRTFLNRFDFVQEGKLDICALVTLLRNEVFPSNEAPEGF